MTTVAQMIEWMKTLPQDAEVNCGVEVIDGHNTYMSYAPVSIECCEVWDYTDEEWHETFPEIAGKCVVQINGE